MAQPKVDYSTQVGNINDPVQSNAGSLIAQSGQLLGNAAKMEGQNNAAALTFLGTTVEQGYKGYKEAGLERDVNAAIDKLEGFGAGAKAAQAKLDYLRGDKFAEGTAEQMVALQEQSGMQEPELVNNFRTDIERYATAQSQGVLTRQQVLDRIAVSVKKYSAEMPGWAKDFREIAQHAINPSGMGALDPTHQALTQAGAREKAQALDMKVYEHVAVTTGIPMSDPRFPSVLANFQASVQIKRKADDITHSMVGVNLDQKEADKRYNQTFALQKADAAMHLATTISVYGGLQSDGEDNAAAASYILKATTDIRTWEALSIKTISEWQRPENGSTPLSADEAKTMLAETRAIASNFEAAVKEVQGRNILKAVVDGAKDDVQLRALNFQQANPFIANMSHIPGLLQSVVPAWFALGSNPTEFDRRFPGFGHAMKEAMTNPQALANANKAAATGAPTSASNIAQISPATAQVFILGLVEDLKKMGQQPLTSEQQQVVYTNLLSNLATKGSDGRPNLNPSSPRDIKMLKDVLTSKGTQERLAELSPELRARAIAPLVESVVAARSGLEGAVQERLSRLNEAWEEQGWTFRRETNGLTGEQRVEWSLDTVQYDKWAAANKGKVLVGAGRGQTMSGPVGGVGMTAQQVLAAGPNAMGVSMKGEIYAINQTLQTTQQLKVVYDQGLKPHVDGLMGVPKNTEQPVAPTPYTGPDRRTPTVTNTVVTPPSVETIMATDLELNAGQAAQVAATKTVKGKVELLQKFGVPDNLIEQAIRRTVKSALAGEAD